MSHKSRKHQDIAHETNQKTESFSTAEWIAIVVLLGSFMAIAVIVFTIIVGVV